MTKRFKHRGTTGGVAVFKEAGPSDHLCVKSAESIAPASMKREECVILASVMIVDEGPSNHACISANVEQRIRCRSMHADSEIAGERLEAAECLRAGNGFCS